METKIIDHVSLLAALSDEQRLSLTEKSDKAGLLHLASYVLALSITGAWVWFGFPGWQGVSILHGLMLVFLFTLLHETVHFTVFKTPQLNQIVGWICALIIFLPPNWFRYFHLAHHRHTNNPEKDPELAGEKPQTWIQYFWSLTGFPVWWFHTQTIFQNALGKCEGEYVPKNGYVKVKTEARIMLSIYAFLIAVSVLRGSFELLYLWIIPVLLGQPFLRLYLMAEHGRCPQVANMLENTRTTYTTRFVRWLAWNMPYHTEHHAYPSVPFYKLTEFNEVAKKHLQITGNGYSEFHRETLSRLAEGKEIV